MSRLRRVALIEPAVDSENLLTSFFAQIRCALPFLAGALRASGRECAIFAEELVDLPRRYGRIAREFDAACVSVTINTAPRAREIARALRRIRPDLPVIFGGARADFHADELLADGGHVLHGRAERTLPALLDALEGRGDPAEVPNLAFLAGGKIVRTRRESLPADFRSDLSGVENYGGFSERRGILGLRKAPLHSLFASTGCVRACRFCVAERGHTPRDLDHVEADLADLLDRHRTMLPPRVMVVDDCPFGDMNHLRGLLDRMARVRRRRAFQALMQFHVKPLLDAPDLLPRLSAAGVGTLLLGFESASDASLAAERKGTSVEANRAAIDACRASGIAPYGYFVAGFDADDEAAVRATFSFIEETGIAAQVLPMGVSDGRSLDPHSFGAAMRVSHRPARMGPARLQELLIGGWDRIYAPRLVPRAGSAREALHRAAFAYAWPRYRPALLRHLNYLRALERFGGPPRRDGIDSI